MKTKTTLFGQHFNISIDESGMYGHNTYPHIDLILSDSDDTRRFVVPIDRYELKDIAEFILKYLENK